MPYDDPRFLQSKIEGLEKQIEALRKATLGFAANQKGVLPGAMRAVSLNDRGQNSTMFMDFRNLGAGLGPYAAVTDTAGTIRAEWGNLAANGISPAQFGFRASNAAGVPIFDSLGLIAVMSQLGETNVFGPIAITSTTPSLISGTAITFSLSRSARILITTSIAANCANANSGSVDVFLDGAVDALVGSSVVQWTTTTTSTGSVTFSETLAAGSHTYDLRGHVIAGNTLTVLSALTFVWLLGT